eukprot:COSAG02_NODE_339_length_24201_cov_45.538462_12_plen_43_part_00
MVVPQLQAYCLPSILEASLVTQATVYIVVGENRCAVDYDECA